MSDSVQFNEDQATMPRRPTGQGQQMPTSYAAVRFQQAQQDGPGGMSGWLIRHGIISSDSGAKVILGLVIGINFLAAALIMYYFVYQ